LYEDQDEELIEELKEAKASFRSTLNKKKVTKWELDEAFLGEV
jgi:hypothetical protein